MDQRDGFGFPFEGQLAHARLRARRHGSGYGLGMALQAQRRAGSPDGEPAEHYSQHSRYSDPGAHAQLLQAVPPDLATVSAVARNTIAHYRASSVPLPESSNADINARWISRILDLDQQRHGVPLQNERAEAERVQGCCRDHTLLAVAILRQHGVPARSRVGFATYLWPDSRVDHVVAETWTGDRWRRFDPELPGPRASVDDPLDIPTGADSPFLIAAAAWSGYRQSGGAIDDLGVQVGSLEFKGAPFVFGYLIMDVAHRFGDELLLWDYWGAMGMPGQVLDVELGDRLADLVLRADAGNQQAEQELADIYAADPRVHPGPQVLQFSPRGEPPRQVALPDRSPATA